MIQFILLAVVLLLVGFYVAIQAYVSSMRKQIVNVNEPGKLLPAMGFFEIMFALAQRKTHLFTLFQQWKQKYGDTYIKFFLGFTTVTFNTPEAAKQILSNWKTFEKQKRTITTRFSRVFGNPAAGISNVVGANGHTWVRQRKSMNAAFYRLDIYMDIFIQKTKETIVKFDKAVKAKSSLELNVHDTLQKMALDILGLTIFGYDFKYLEGTNQEVVDAYHTVINGIFSVLNLLLPFTAYLPTPGNLRMQRSIDTMNKLIDRLIAQSKQKLSNPDFKGLSMLDWMVESVEKQEGEEGKLSPEELRVNIFVFFVAGHETTASALTSALYCLAKYPDVQEKLYQEIVKHIGRDENNISFENLGKIEYLDWVIKENMRLFPPVASIPNRELAEDVVIEGWKVPKGWRVDVGVITMHMDDRYFKEPRKFIPERFSPEESKTRHPFAYIPFSAGPRVCVGNNFSLWEQRVFLAFLVLKYKLILPSPDFELVFDSKKAFIATGDNLRLTFAPRV